MGLLDIAAKVLTTYQADTSDMKAKLKDLAGTERDLAKQQLAAAEARNKQSDDWVTKLGKVGLAFDIVSRGVQFAFDGLKDYGHRLDLESTAGGVSLDKLSRAAGGLKTNMELLEHAAVFNASAFKLTEDQMVTAERAMRALEDRGKDSQAVWSAVSSALTQGTTGALEGLIGPIKKTSDAFDVNGDVIQTYGAKAKAVDAILKQLAVTGAEVKEGQYDAADSVSKTAVGISNAMDSIKQSMGKVVVSLEPLIAGVAKLAEVAAPLISTIADGWADVVDAFRYLNDNDAFNRSVAARHGIDIEEQARGTVENWEAGGGNVADLISGYITAQTPATDGRYDGGAGSILNPIAEFSKLWQRAEIVGDRLLSEGKGRLLKMQERYKKEVAAGKAWAEERRKLAGEVAKNLTDDLVKELEKQLEDEKAARIIAPIGDAARASWSQMPDIAALDSTLEEFNRKALAEQAADKRTSFLESTFGKLEDFNAYKTAFDTLGGATSAALSAWIDGSMSAGEAFKRFIGEALKSLASQMLIESLKHTAYAIGDLASGNLPGAALHGAAAAAFGAGAAAAAISARQLGAGPPGASSTSGGGARASAPNVSGGDARVQPTGGIVVIGDSFAEDTPRMKQLRARRLVRLASGSNNAVIYE